MHTESQQIRVAHSQLQHLQRDTDTAPHMIDGRAYVRVCRACGTAARE